jgi:hypothetical protein
MKRLSLVTALLALSVPSFAVEPPKEIADRYKALMKAIEKVDVKAFSQFYDKSYVYVAPSGKESKRDAYLREYGGMLKSMKSGTTNLKITDVNAMRDTVTVTYDFHGALHDAKGGGTAFHEVGVDTWKKIGGKWMEVKTVDTLMEVKPIAVKSGKRAKVR